MARSDLLRRRVAGTWRVLVSSSRGTEHHQCCLGDERSVYLAHGAPVHKRAVALLLLPKVVAKVFARHSKFWRWAVANPPLYRGCYQNRIPGTTGHGICRTRHVSRAGSIVVLGVANITPCPLRCSTRLNRRRPRSSNEGLALRRLEIGVLGDAGDIDTRVFRLRVGKARLVGDVKSAAWLHAVENFRLPGKPPLQLVTDSEALEREKVRGQQVW